jgi:arabidopsis histidine kinase 2/3/4 (cytokinin receptor)
VLFALCLYRFTQNPPLPWLAITTSLGTLVIALLIGHIFHATVNRIAKVEDDYREMMELKKRAEAADVAKSQVPYLIPIL